MIAWRDCKGWNYPEERKRGERVIVLVLSAYWRPLPLIPSLHHKTNGTGSPLCEILSICNTGTGNTNAAASYYEASLHNIFRNRTSFIQNVPCIHRSFVSGKGRRKMQAGWQQSEKKATRIVIGPVPRTRSYEKDDEPLLNLTGTMSSCSREKVLLCTYTKEGTRVPSLNTEGLVCTR